MCKNISQICAPVRLGSLKVGQYFELACDLGPRYQVKRFVGDSALCELCWGGYVYSYVNDALVIVVTSSHPCFDPPQR